MWSGTDLIQAERVSQAKQWTAKHDDCHDDGSLAVVAATLAVDGTDASVADPLGRGSPGHGSGDCWGLVRKHKDNRIRQLAIAGALIAAEIDRIQRANG